MNYILTGNDGLWEGWVGRVYIPPHQKEIHCGVKRYLLTQSFSHNIMLCITDKFSAKEELSYDALINATHVLNIP